MQAMPDTGGKSELIGIGIALLVLIITFGSLVAAGMPIISALVGVGVGMIGIQLATSLVTLPTTTSMLATMIGLAVGIDYTLFILSRYRTELKHTERTLVQSFAGDDRGDRTDSVSLGARWTPIRPLLVGCDIGHEQRSSRGFDVAVRPSYTNNSYGCYAQFILK